MSDDEAKQRDRMRTQLSQDEDAILKAFEHIEAVGGDARWLALARTNLQLAFMCAKRGLYEGKRVGD